MMLNPKISVLVPVYNAEVYLGRCVESILQQSFTDFELILVNDGSKDGSLTICERYSEKDSRVIVLNQPNSGVSAARNHAMDVASGDYLCFVDSDDYVGPLYLEQLYYQAKLDNRIDLVIQGRIKCDGSVQTIISPQYNGSFFLKENSTFFEVVDLFRFCAVFSKLYKKTIIKTNRIMFVEQLNHGEDFDFLVRYLLNCEGVYVSDCSNYFYVINVGSLSSKYSSFEQEYKGLECLYKSISCLENVYKNPSLNVQTKAFLSYYLIRVLNSIYKQPIKKRSERLKYLKSIDNRYIKIYKVGFVPPTYYSWLCKMLYVGRCFLLYDLAYSLVMRK